MYSLISGQVQVIDFCVHANEASDLINREEFCDQLREYQLLTKNCVSWASLHMGKTCRISIMLCFYVRLTNLSFARGRELEHVCKLSGDFDRTQDVYEIATGGEIQQSPGILRGSPHIQNYNNAFTDSLVCCRLDSQLTGC